MGEVEDTIRGLQRKLNRIRNGKYLKEKICISCGHWLTPANVETTPSNDRICPNCDTRVISNTSTR